MEARSTWLLGFSFNTQEHLKLQFLFKIFFLFKRDRRFPDNWEQQGNLNKIGTAFL